MGLRDWLAGLGRKWSSTTPAVLSLVSSGQPVWTPDNYEALAKEGYTTCVYAYRAIDTVAQAAAGVPLLLYRRSNRRGVKAIQRKLAGQSAQGRIATMRSLKASGDLLEIEDHPLLTLLDRPNPMQGGSGFRADQVAYRLIAGNAYTERVGPDDPRRPPLELWNLRPDRMQVIAGSAAEPIQGYEYAAGGVRRTVAKELIWHWKTFNPLDDWYGLPPLKAASRAIDQNNTAKAWNVAALQNSARPSGAFMSKGTLGDREFARQQKQIQDMRGHLNAGKILLVEDGMTWQQMGLSPVDMDWLEGQKLSAREIGMAFGVPPQLIGDTESSTYANYQEARKALYHETVLPLLDNYVDELNRWLVPLYGDDLLLAFDADAIEALQEDRDKVWARVKDAPFLSVNEARAAVGYDAVEADGDVLLWQLDVYKRFGTFAPMGTPTTGAKSMPAPADTKADVQTIAIEKRRAPYEKALAAQVVKRFEAERKAVLASVKADPSGAGVDAVLAEQLPTWQKLYAATYTAIAEGFAAEQLAGLKAAAHRIETKATSAEELAVIRQIVATYISTHGTSRTEMLQASTGKAILAAVKRAAQEGGDAAAIMTAVDDVYQGWMGKAIAESAPASVAPEVAAPVSRAVSIASDFVVGASGLGLQAGAKASGLPLTKKWRDTGDKRVRPTHKSANGQTVKMDQPFSVGGSQLMFPGDTSLGALGEASRCRCFAVYDLDEDAMR